MVFSKAKGTGATGKACQSHVPKWASGPSLLTIGLGNQTCQQILTVDLTTRCDSELQQPSYKDEHKERCRLRGPGHTVIPVLGKQGQVGCELEAILDSDVNVRQAWAI